MAVEKSDEEKVRARRQAATDQQTRALAEWSGSASALVHRLGREIVSGLFPPGTRLPAEATMLQRYGVSRTALREAYGKLSAKGVIVARPKVGTSVRAVVHWNMLDPEVLSWHLQTRPAEDIAQDLYALRRMVEPTAAALAASFRDEDELVEIQSAFNLMQESAGDETALVEADLRFHIAVLRATHNHFIGAFSSLIHAAMLSTFQISWRGAEAAVIKQERLLQHGDVLEAVRRQQPDIARTRMEILLDDSINDVAGALDAAD